MTTPAKCPNCEIGTLSIHGGGGMWCNSCDDRPETPVDAYDKRNRELMWALKKMVDLSGKAWDLLENDCEHKCLKVLAAMSGERQGYLSDLDYVHAILNGDNMRKVMAQE